MSEQGVNKKEIYLVTTNLNGSIGPLGTIFNKESDAEDAANFIKRSNGPIIIHLVNSAYVEQLERENDELKKQNKKLESDIHLLTKVDKLTTIRIKEPGNAFYQECFKEHTEKIRKLEKEKADLIEALKFYANKSNWYPNERFKESGRIDDNDLEHFPGNQTSDLIGGKIARKALEGLE
ncbi:MAG: hypothetical protein ACXVB1_08980 [Pseudobdellovibrionaceae bacterium]